MTTISLPKHLYKYVPFDRLNVLQNECIRFTQPAALNDPWELKPYFESLFDWESLKNSPAMQTFTERMVTNQTENVKKLDSEVTNNKKDYLDALNRFRLRFSENDKILRLIEEERKRTELISDTIKPKDIEEGIKLQLDQLLQDMSNENANLLPEIFCNSLGVLSLTIKPTNDLMWSHYAGDHTGMVLEFDTSQEFFNQNHTNECLSTPKPVTYSLQRPGFKSIEQLGGRTNFWEAFVFTKSQSWAYEEEWRIVRLLKDADEVNNEKSPPVHLYKLPSITISSVILGALMPKENRQVVIDFLSGDPRYQHVCIQQAKISNRTFDLEIEPLATL